MDKLREIGSSGSNCHVEFIGFELGFAPDIQITTTEAGRTDT